MDFLALQVLVEPGDDVLQTLDAMDGLAGTGQLVRLAWKPHHDYRLLQILQRAEHSVRRLRRAACGSRTRPRSSRAAHTYTAHEPARPVVAPAHAIVVLEEHRQVHIPFVKGCGDPIPVPYD
jgi:hypothetical protein